MTDLAKLIADIEGAEAGSRELDARIKCHFLGWTFEQWDGAGAICRREGRIRHLANNMFPHYTTNLQDAVDAVPEGTWYWHIRKFKHTGRRHDAMVTLRKPAEKADNVNIQVTHRHPTLALCAAILRAKELERKDSL